MSVVTPDQQYPSHSHDYRSCSVRELRHFIQEHTTPTVGDKYRKHNKAKLVFHLKKLDAAAAGTLDYRACDLGELYDFIKSRTALTAAAIRKLDKAEMVTHLVTLDTQRIFSRFMDLPTELRLDIYQRLLLINGQQDGKNHSALLRVSKLIHREAEPVLYCDNTFYVDAGLMDYRLIVSESWKTHWNPSPPHNIPACPVRADMLLGLRQLTVRLEVSDGFKKDPWYHNHYAHWAQSAFANICLMLSSASKLKTLKITNIPSNSNLWGDDLLLSLVSPVVLLPETTTVNLEGGRHALHNALEDLRRQTRLHPDRTLSDCGTLLSSALHHKGDALYRVKNEVKDEAKDRVKDDVDDEDEEDDGEIFSMTSALFLVLMVARENGITGTHDDLKTRLQVLETCVAMADAGFSIGTWARSRR
jgi:hypothetical protein